VLNYLIQKDQKQVQQGGRKRIGFWKKFLRSQSVTLEIGKGHHPNYLIQKDQKQVQQGGRNKIGFWNKDKKEISERV
jgi:hypothetical protein